MDHQTSLDLKSRFLKAAGTDGTAPKKSGYGSPKQQNWIRNLLFERFPEDEASQRWEAIDWQNMTRALFDKMLKFLRGLPTLEAQGLGDQAAKPQVLTMPGDFHHGIYTVTYPDETYTVIRVRMQDVDSDFKPGETLLAFQSGPSNEHDYTGFGHVAEGGTVKVWHRHRNDPRWTRALKVMFGTPDDADQAATVHVDVKCMLCHRPLTRPSSIDARMGKDCADKAGLGQ